MTYIACITNKDGIVIGSDSRANYFDDYIKDEKIIGKQIKFYWDGNKKIFLVKDRFIIAAQGLLFWGNEKLLLSENIKNFENNLGEKETIRSVASKIYHYFINSKRKTDSASETMHFIVAGFENKTPKGFYANTCYNKALGIEELPFDNSKTLYVNGDGKGEWIHDIFSIKDAIDFCKAEILKKHKETPFDIGNRLDVLVMPVNGVPYWETITEKNVTYKTYNELTNAINSGNLKVENLPKPKVLLYS